VIVYAYVVIEYCDELFMMLKCVVWLKYENDDMHIFMELIVNLYIYEWNNEITWILWHENVLVNYMYCKWLIDYVWD
jgi:hypothetical protein